MNQSQLEERILRLERKIEELTKRGGYAGIENLPGLTRIWQNAEILGSLTLPESFTPSTPTVGQGSLYFGTDSWPRAINDLGKIIPLGVNQINLPINGAYATGIVYSQTVAGNPQAIFDNAAVDILDWSIMMPPEWNQRPVYFDFIWWTTSGAGNVEWIAEARYQRHDGPLVSSPHIYGIADIASNNVVKKNTIYMGVINCPTDETGLAVRFYRSGNAANDTYANTAQLLAASIRVT